MDSETISLDHGATIRVVQLSEDTKNYILENFGQMYKLKPDSRHKIVSYNEEIETYRWSRSYMNTPVMDASHVECNTYMFSGFDQGHNREDLPELFQPIYKEIKDLDSRYNQCVINWYRDEQDMIAMHSDCERQMVPDYNIAIVSLYPSVEESRELKVKPKGDNNNSRQITIPLYNGTVVIIDSQCNKNYVHGISRYNLKKTNRISMSFRQIL